VHAPDQARSGSLRLVLQQALRDRYLEGTDLTGTLASGAQAYHQLGWDGIRYGGVQLGSLSAGEKMELGEVAAHVLKVIGHDII
jgi:hypothetical protein